MIRHLIHDLITEAIRGGVVSLEGELKPFSLERGSQDGHGDFTTNFALANRGGAPLAERLAAAMAESEAFAKVEVLRGHVNFHLSPGFVASHVGQTLQGAIPLTNKPISHNVEYVSVNPNGPVTVASGRGAVVGDTYCRVLSAVGHDVTREYYVNDGANSEQMRLFGLSVAHHIKLESGQESTEPEGGYKGAYVAEIAKRLIAEGCDVASADAVTSATLEMMVADQKASLANFHCEFDVWFHESQLLDSGALDATLKLLAERGHTKTVNGAVFLKTSEFGDQEDRVLVRSDGRPTYFLSDVAYLTDKAGRGYDEITIIVGPDHHGYIARLKAAAEMISWDPARLHVELFQVVHFVDALGQPAPMRKRDGNIYALADLIEMAGVDTCRWFYLSQGASKPMNFNLDKAREISFKNPVYYVQYACARAHSAFTKALQAGVMSGLANLPLCSAKEEVDLMVALDDWPAAVTAVAEGGIGKVHTLCDTAYELARHFHAWYDACRIVTDDLELSRARATLAFAFFKNMESLLQLMGIAASKSMPKREEVAA